MLDTDDYNYDTDLFDEEEAQRFVLKSEAFKDISHLSRDIAEHFVKLSSLIVSLMATSHELRAYYKKASKAHRERLAAIWLKAICLSCFISLGVLLTFIPFVAQYRMALWVSLAGFALYMLLGLILSLSRSAMSLGQGEEAKMSAILKSEVEIARLYSLAASILHLKEDEREGLTLAYESPSTTERLH